jgi:DNA-binding winged helix-turn-helix (wHTH) protein/TolB-like protein
MTVGKKFHYEFYDFRLDVQDHQLLKNGQPIQLTPKTFQVLELLFVNSGQTIKKEEIFDRLWPDNFVEEGNLTQHIHVLRKTLGRKPDEQSYIETVPKQGYRFTLQPHEIKVVEEASATIEVDRPHSPETGNGFHLPLSADAERERSDEPESRLPDRSLSEDDQGTFDEAAPNAAASSRVRTLLICTFLVLGMIAATGIFYYFRPAARMNAIADPRSIAVLPFKTIGGELDREKVGLGMADAVITQLSKQPQLEVRPTSAIFQYVDQPELDSVELGRRLEVDVVLEGTVQREDDRVKVSIQLLKVPEGTTMLAESYYESASDIFVVQDVISKRIVSTLSLRLSPTNKSLLSERYAAGRRRSRQVNALVVF